MERLLGRLLLVTGLGLVALGGMLLSIGRVPWLGRLPGDLRLSRDGLSITIPLATCMVLSLVATIVLNLLAKR